MGYDTMDDTGADTLARMLLSYDIDTSLVGVKYKNTFYQFNCTDEGGFNEFDYYKKVDGRWEWADEIRYKIEEMS